MKKDSGTRSGLLWEVERLLTETKERPQVLLMENVPAILSDQHRPNFIQWLECLEGLGYKNYFQKLNAKRFGIPQNRNRIFMVSALGDYYYDFPEGFPLSKKLGDILEKKVPESFYLSDTAIKGFERRRKSRDQKGNGFGYSIAGDVAPTLTARYHKDGKECLVKKPLIGRIVGRNPDNPTSRVSGLPTQQMLEITKNGISGVLTTVQKDNVVIEPSGIYTEVSEEFQSGALKGLSRTIKANKHDAGVVEPYLYQHLIEGYRIRKLMPLECWRLMGFSDEDFYKAKAAGVSNSQLYKQAGNSIVVAVLEAIFGMMF